MAYMEYTMVDLPEDVRELVRRAVRVLADRGPRGLVEEGLCPPELEDGMILNRNDYPGKLIEIPDSAELDMQVNGDGVWKIDLPLYDEEQGRLDLFIFLEVDPKTHSVRVVDLYTP